MLSGARVLLFNSATVCASMSLGDVACQVLEQGGPAEFEWNRRRTGVMSATGFFVNGPVAFGVYRVIDAIVPAAARWAVAKKVGLNVLMAPALISITFGSVTLLSGKSPAEVQAKVKADVLPTFMAGCWYWPLVQTVNFRYVPINQRPTFASVMGTFWSVYVSYKANGPVGGVSSGGVSSGDGEGGEGVEGAEEGPRRENNNNA